MTSQLIDPLDSYFMYVSQQMQKIDTSQMMAGVINARDWPQTPPLDSALYLLYLAAVPVPQIRQLEAQICYEYTCQWTWLLMGTDIQKNQQKQNRGDRYRQDFRIQENLRQASYAGYCAKFRYTSDPNTGQLTATPFLDPAVGGAESLWWSKLRFAPKQDSEKSGLTYGAASVKIYSYSDVDVAVA